MLMLSLYAAKCSAAYCSGYEDECARIDVADKQDMDETVAALRACEREVVIISAAAEKLRDFLQVNPGEKLGLPFISEGEYQSDS